MPHWTVISKQRHATARYRPRQGYHHARERLVAPILLAELPKVVPHCVLGFLPQGEGFTAVALLGLNDGHNLYVHPDGRWLGGYVPASLRGYPFQLLPDAQGQQVLCIDAAQLTDDPEQGEALFTDNGQPAEAVAHQLDFQRHCAANQQRTQRAVDALQRAGVLAPWPLTIPRGEAVAPHRVEGLYRIDEQRLNTLDAATYATLQGAPMALIHAQLFAAHQAGQLAERAAFHARQGETDAPDSLDPMFEDDDDLTFDFDR